jgi:predicted metal-dependent peptidase
MNTWAKEDPLAAARAYSRIYAPYLSSTLYDMVPTPYEGLTKVAQGPLAVTERLLLLYEPSWVAEVSTHVLATGLAHECFHNLLKHVKRGKTYPDPKRFNRAADLFINGTMARQTHEARNPVSKSVERVPTWCFPEWALMPEQYGFDVGLSADEYYLLLEKHEQAQEKQKSQEGGCAEEGSTGEDATEAHSVMRGCCGGVAGNPLSQELEARLDQTSPYARSDSKLRESAKRMAEALKAHLEGPGRGSMPGFAHELLDVSDSVFRVPWRTKLGNTLRNLFGQIQTGSMDYSKRRPSKRSYTRGIILPGLVAYEPVIWLIVDSSGSMGTTQLRDALRICVDVLRQTGIPYAWFLDADTKVQQQPRRVAVRDLLRTEIQGRGGTDFRPAIEMADKHRPRPNAVIYITDGDGCAPTTPPAGIHFVWAVVPSRYRAVPASWGDVIMLEEAVSEKTLNKRV